MKVPMLIKAKKILNGGGVQKGDITSESEYWNVEDYDSKKIHQVTFKRIFPKGGKIPYYTLDCDCTINALQPKDRPLCAHKVAFLLKRFYEPQFLIDFKCEKKWKTK